MRAALGAWGAACASAVEGLRPVAAERLHLTLVFLGQVPAARADELGARVVACADGPVSVALGDALWLAPRRPHVLTAELRDAGGALGALQARVADALGVHEDRPYRPHVTVARVARGVRIRPGEVALPPAPSGTVALESVSLQRSVLGRAARYEAVASAPLR